jgi:hypothetical protein
MRTDLCSLDPFNSFTSHRQDALAVVPYCRGGHDVLGTFYHY